MVVNFEEHREIVDFEILDDSNYLGFSPEYLKMEVETFEIEKIKNVGMQKSFKSAFSINMRNL